PRLPARPADALRPGARRGSPPKSYTDETRREIVACDNSLRLTLIKLREPTRANSPPQFADGHSAILPFRYSEANFKSSIEIGHHRDLGNGRVGVGRTGHALLSGFGRPKQANRKAA